MSKKNLGLLVAAGALILVIVLSISLVGDKPTVQRGSTHVEVDQKEEAVRRIQKLTIPPEGGIAAAVHEQQSNAGRLNFEASLTAILSRHSAASARQGCPQSASRLAGLKYLHLDEVRLLALTFPKESLNAAQRLIQDLSHTESERYCGVFILFTLADEGISGAQEKLLEVAVSQDASLTSKARNLAAHLKDNSRFRSVLIEAAIGGSVDALYAMGEWMDEQSHSVLLSLSANDTNLALYAQEALKQQEILRQSNWQTSVLNFLSDENARPSLRMWAMRVATARKVPGLQEALRERLNVVQSRYIDEFADRIARTSPEEASSNATYKNSFITTQGISRIDKSFDDLLISLMSIGGSLTPLELERLTYLGYAGNYGEKLSALLASE